MKMFAITKKNKKNYFTPTKNDFFFSSSNTIIATQTNKCTLRQGKINNGEKTKIIDFPFRPQTFCVTARSLSQIFSFISRLIFSLISNIIYLHTINGFCDKKIWNLFKMLLCLLSSLNDYEVMINFV